MSVASQNEPEGFIVNFNQDCSSLFVGYKNGYSLFSLSTTDNVLDEIYRCTSEDIRLVERLFSSSLVAIVTVNCPRKLKVCHFKKGTEICNYSYSNTVLAIKLNRARLIVCLSGSLYIHNIRDMKVVHTIRDTPPNPNGLCALAPDSDNCFLAYPGSGTIGEVQIFDAVNLQAKLMIPAHDSPLAAIAFSYSGLELATASEKGTVIRVFSVKDGSKLFEFRRGMKRCVSIASLSFSTCSNYLSCSSNTETVHIFRLERAPNGDAGQGGGSGGGGGSGSSGGGSDWMGFLKSGVETILPTQVSKVFNQGRAWATAMLPLAGLRHSCVITTVESQQRLLVASSDGFVYVYQIPTGSPGLNCQLIKTHDLRNIANTPPPQRPAGADGGAAVPVLVPTSTTNTGGTSYADTLKVGSAGGGGEKSPPSDSI